MKTTRLFPPLLSGTVFFFVLKHNLEFLQKAFLILIHSFSKTLRASRFLVGIGIKFYRTQRHGGTEFLEA
ncbi:hypothetical protein, partial [uncultured Phocaeicola sp.]|uniref:hypothetical protein n=1 Tax=uncultured Phocaeicola sp. TaxID=990718 RepID=UPI0025E5BEF0